MPTAATDEILRRTKLTSRLMFLRTICLDMRSDQRIFATDVRNENKRNPRTPSAIPHRGEKGDGRTPLAAGRTFDPESTSGVRRPDFR